MERLELFDEMEEWRLIQGHYCVAWGVNQRGTFRQDDSGTNVADGDDGGGGGGDASARVSGGRVDGRQRVDGVGGNLFAAISL